MDYSATGFEWLAAPLLILLRSDRLIFLINLISYALMPGLIFALLRGLRIGQRVSWVWMWILPTAYCFVLQAGSIGNDMFSTDYLLASAVFALRAAKSGSWMEAGLSILAAALMTGAKASNLPLLLPLGFLIIPLAKTLMAGPLRCTLLVIVAGMVSFLPMALINLRHTGDWTGDPSNSEKMKLANPIAGLVGNSLQTLVGVLLPPVFPMAKNWNSSIEILMEQVPMRSLKLHYPRFTLSAGELATEECAGFGPVIPLLCLMALVFVPLHGCKFRMNRPALLFGGLCWVAFLVFMTKIGSESSARLASPYYLGLAVPFIALHSNNFLIRRRWWICVAVLCTYSLLPAVLLNPARPMIPPSLLIAIAGKLLDTKKSIDRIKKVYEVYENRSDSLGIIRNQLSPKYSIIGFAGTGNEAEYSLWKPFSSVKVVDVGFDNNIKVSTIECMVGSHDGFIKRFGEPVNKVADMIGGKIFFRVPLAIFASRELEDWFLVLPSSPQGFHGPKKIIR